MRRRKTRASTNTIFVTGTDTCAGKTLLAGFLLLHFRQAGLHALAMKPFCSGGRGDVDLLNALQNSELTADEINPFYFDEPVAPLIAARHHQKKITLSEVLDRVQKLKIRCERLVIEGAGGVLVPLGEGYSILDLVLRLHCPVVIAARNRLGVINHTLLTVKCMQAVGIKSITVVLMGCSRVDASTQSNLGTLQEMLAPIRVFSIPFLGKETSRAKAVRTKYKKIKKTIALLADFDILPAFF